MQIFLKDIDEKHGVVYMDIETKRTTEEIFELKLSSPVIPIFSSPAEKKREWQGHNIKNTTLNIFWLGRLGDFKYATVCSIAKTISNLDISEDIVFHIIGDGPQYEFCQSYIADLGNVTTKFYGYIDLIEVDDLLTKKADLLLGHGLSILQGARLGIPCILVDGMYKITDPKFLKCDWLFNQHSFNVGKISYKNEDFEGELLGSLLKNVKNENLEFLGESTYSYWERNHSAKSIVEKYSHEIRINTYTYDDFMKAEVEEKDTFLIKIRELLKPIYYHFLGVKNDKK